MIKRKLVISDIHGCYDEFIDLLSLVNYNPDDDKLILLGDYVNRGNKSKETLNKIIELHNHGSIILKGNHDEWFVKFLDNPTKYYSAFTQKNIGGCFTLKNYLDINNLDSVNAEDYANFIKTNYSDHVNLLRNLPYFYEDDNHLYVHAGIDPSIESTKDIINKNCLTMREPFLNTIHKINKTVVFGHTTCIRLHDNADIWYAKNKIGIDGGCCFNFQLNCLEIINDFIYYHYSVKKIIPK